MNKRFIALIVILIIAVIGISVALSNHEPAQNIVNNTTSNNTTNDIQKNVTLNASIDSLLQDSENGAELVDIGYIITGLA
jgi:uncharacterized protein YpmS